MVLDFGNLLWKLLMESLQRIQLILFADMVIFTTSNLLVLGTPALMETAPFVKMVGANQTKLKYSYNDKQDTFFSVQYSINIII